MGDMADYMWDEMLKEQFEFDMRERERFRKAEQILKEYEAGTLQWKTRQDELILISDMEYRHLLNSLKMIGRQIESNDYSEGFLALAKAWESVLIQELIKREQ